MIWIVGGPTSAGKSFFLGSPHAEEVTGLPRGTRVLFPRHLGPPAPPPDQDAYVHYNILRPFQRQDRPQDVAIGPRMFEGDAQWRAVLAIPADKKAVVVVTDRETLVRRVKARRSVETGDPHEYGIARWLRIYEAVDVEAVYDAWRAELAWRGIASVEVDGGGGA